MPRVDKKIHNVNIIDLKKWISQGGGALDKVDKVFV